MFSHAWGIEMGEGSGPQGNIGTAFECFVVPTNGRASHLQEAGTASGQTTPKLSRPLEIQGGSNHQPGDMMPLRC